MRGQRHISRVLFVCLITWLSGSAAEATTFTRCAPGNAACLIAAMRAAQNNGQENWIFLEAGTYSITEVDAEGDGLTGLPAIIGSTVVISGAGRDKTIIQRASDDIPFHQAPLFRLFTVTTTGFLEFYDVTLRRGNVGFFGQGGAIYSQARVHLFNTEIRDSYAGRAGAVYLPDGDLIMSGSRLTNNSGDFGGGVVMLGCPVGCAGVASARISNSTISGNAAQAEGIIVKHSGGSLFINETAIIGNRTDTSGVVSIGAPAGVVEISSTTISGTVGRDAVAISAQSNLLAINSTIVNNQGGISGFGPLRIQNTIVAGNDRNGDCANFGSDPGVVSLGHNLFGNSSRCGALLPSDLTGDPGLGAFIDARSLGQSYFPLLADSRLIDAGDAAACPAGSEDQRGLLRGVDGDGDGVRGCDIGAVEFYPVVNDRLQLEGLQASFVKFVPFFRPVVFSPVTEADPRASAGAYRINAVFGNTGPDICNVAFEIVALDGPAGTNPVLLTDDRPEVGAGGIVTTVFIRSGPASIHLPSGAADSYPFEIGVQQRTPINFMINVLGDATSGPCGQ